MKGMTTPTGKPKKQCALCLDVKTLSFFPKSGKTKTGQQRYQVYCKDCWAFYNRVWRSERKGTAYDERVRRTVRVYRKRLKQTDPARYTRSIQRCYRWRKQKRQRDPAYAARMRAYDAAYKRERRRNDPAYAARLRQQQQARRRRAREARDAA